MGRRMLEKTGRDASGSLYRAASLLAEIAATGADGATVAGLAARSGMARPTVHRVCAMLEDIGWIERDADTRRLHLGPELATLGLVAQRRSPLESLARPVLEDLSREIGQTLYLMRRQGDEAVCIARIEGRGLVRTLLLDIGSRWPLGYGAAGMAILAALPEDEAEGVLRRNLPALAGQGEAALRSRLAETRQAGVARHEGMILPGVSGLGAAIYDRSGQPVASLSAGYVATWMDAAALTRCREGIPHAARQISALLGRRDVAGTT